MDAASRIDARVVCTPPLVSLRTTLASMCRIGAPHSKDSTDVLVASSMPGRVPRARRPSHVRRTGPRPRSGADGHLRTLHTTINAYGYYCIQTIINRSFC